MILPLPTTLEAPVPAPLDLLLVACFAIGFTLLEHYVFWPRARARVAARGRDARLGTYRVIISAQWLLVAVVALRLRTAGVSWATLGLAMPTGWRLAASIALVTLVAVLYLMQWRALRRLPAERLAALRERTRASFSDVAVVLPHTRRESRWFVPVALTAGTCEELLYRGYAVWALAPWTGHWGAMLVSVALFGVGHSYQGARSAVRSGIVGATLQAIVVLAGSLVPAMITHAIIDLGGGAVGFLLARDDEAGDASTPPMVSAAHPL